MINNISFGRKVPIYKAAVIHNHRKEPVTLYQYDCKDMSDLDSFDSIKGEWDFKEQISRLLYNSIRENKSFGHRSHDVYVLESNKNNDILAMGAFTTRYTGNILSYIESKSDKKYKYIGSTFLAATGKHLLKQQRPHMKVGYSLQSAIPFYQKLGFVQSRNIGNEFQASEKELNKLIKYAQRKTRSRIVDIEA